MKSPSGFVTDPSFQAGTPAVPAIATGEVFFNGNSQGGIIGGAATAISTEWTRAVLGVPGMNFSTLLTRSTHWDNFSPVLFNAYADELTRSLGYSIIQMLWDRGEANGYAHHMTRPQYANTPPHTVLMHAAFGDHQVANIAAEVEARTIHAGVRIPALDPGRHSDLNPFFKIPKFNISPYAGPALVYWDSGSPTPPTGNVPPRAGTDPHSHPRSTALARQQKSDFLQLGGRVVNVCGASPCYANGYTGNGQ
jgi:hypothetical protein